MENCNGMCSITKKSTTIGFCKSFCPARNKQVFCFLSLGSKEDEIYSGV